MTAFLSGPQKKALQKRYAEMHAATLQSWVTHPGAGRTLAPAYSGDLFGVTLGALFRNKTVKRLMDSLEYFASLDKNIDVLPSNALHITILSCMPLTFRNVESIPGIEIDSALLIKRLLKPHRPTLHDVRIIAVNNAILLAGIPDRATTELRKSLISIVSRSCWGSLLDARYGRKMPDIWHTTLARSNAEYLHPSLRETVTNYASMRIDKLECLPVECLLANYNWTKRKPFDLGTIFA